MYDIDSHDMTSVRQMLWLRAYARKCRWDEKVVIIPLEVESTPDRGQRRIRAGRVILRFWPIQGKAGREGPLGLHKLLLEPFPVHD